MTQANERAGKAHMRAIKSAVVTGPTGAVGTALCEKLKASGIRVVAVVRPGSPRVGALPGGIDVVACDLSEISHLPEQPGVERVDAFFHLAWAHTTGPGRDDVGAQMDNARHAVDAARAAGRLGCKVFVGAGSQAEYGRVEGALAPDTPTFPENAYGAAKLCAGEMTRLECARLGVDHVWARILSVYGPNDGPNSVISATIRKLLNGERPTLTAGTQMWDFLYSKDAAEALALCALCGKDGAVYPLGSGAAAPLRTYLEALRDAIDPALPLGFGEVPFGPAQVTHLQADLSVLRADTGFAPAYSFERGIKETIDWMRCSR